MIASAKNRACRNGQRASCRPLKGSMGRLIIAAGVLIAVLLVFNLYLLAQRAGDKEQLEALSTRVEELEKERAGLLENFQALEQELVSVRAEKAALKERTGVEEGIFTMKGLVEVRDLCSGLEVELKYATEDNFTGRRLYPVEVCLLREETAKKLAAANAEFMADGYRLKIWDAYRPLSVQEALWEQKPDPVYVADPETGSNHNRGAAVDVTLVDEEGRELEMPTGFDVFTAEASRSYPDMSSEARENMEYLTEVMVKNGFTPIESEWWHFNDADVAEYAIIDLDLEDFVAGYFSR